MPELEDIRILNVDGVPHTVDSFSPAIQQMVKQYNEWRRYAVEKKTQFDMAQAALGFLSRQIMETIQSEMAANADPDVSNGHEDDFRSRVG